MGTRNRKEEDLEVTGGRGQGGRGVVELEWGRGIGRKEI